MSEQSEQQRQNLELTRRAFEAFNAADVAGMLSLVSEDVEVYSSPELMNAGTYSGHEGFLRWTQEWSDAWAELAIEVTSVEPVGEKHVITLVNQHAKGRGGIELEMKVAFLFEAHAGLCTFLALVPDTERAKELVRERLAA
jgi:ketosteroid isomerase-like protein